MVLAAGRGTRLGALGTHTPKALVPIDGTPLLEITLRRLAAAGCHEVIVNVHHLAAQIEHFVADRGGASGFGLQRLEFSREDELLDTGGGLQRAAPFLAGETPFLVHNVDVLSDLDLAALLRDHAASGALASLWALPRPTRRPLLFDARGQLVGRVGPGGPVLVRPPAAGAPPAPLGFCGIHAASPAILDQLTETPPFGLADCWLRLAAAGASIRVHRADHTRWRDCGRPEDLRPL
jgi:NDP-sugar pyrophosphorylase family protein